MAKPIFVIDIPENKKVTYDIGKLQKHLTESLGNEYHVLLSVSRTHKEIKYQCFNDHKELPDGSIETIINEYTKRLNTNQSIKKLILDRAEVKA